MNEIATPWPGRVAVVTGEPDPLWFTAAERLEADAWRLPKRRAEWLLGRAAAKHLAMHLGLCSEARACGVGRPRLSLDGTEAAWYVSISHSGEFAAAALAPTPVGVDVQVVRPLPEEAAHLFLSDLETEAMRACRTPDALLHFWCAKEAAFKRHSPRFTTLRQVPLRLLTESPVSLQFDEAETFRTAGILVALSA